MSINGIWFHNIKYKSSYFNLPHVEYIVGEMSNRTMDLGMIRSQITYIAPKWAQKLSWFDDWPWFSIV